MRSAATGCAALLAALILLAAAAATLLSTERVGEGSMPAMAILISLFSAAAGGWTAAGLHGAQRLPTGLLVGGAVSDFEKFDFLLVLGVENQSLYKEKGFDIFYWEFAGINYC